MSSEKETSVNGKSSPRGDGKISSSSNSNVKKSHRIRVSGASGKHEDEELSKLFSKFGEVKLEKHNYQEDLLVATMESVESANKAVAQLNGSEFQGHKLSLNNDSANQRRPMPRRSAPPVPMAPVFDDYPVRLLINADLVGAVIGKGGETIKEITSKTKARIDVKREVVQRTLPSRKTINSQIVFISGAPEACTQACKEILSICMSDSKDRPKEDRDTDLNLLAEDRFCGRIIGKDGKNLKIIREKTNTSIHLSNSPTVTAFDANSNNFSMDRIVTVRGNLDGMCQAESFLSEKLRQCHQMETPQYHYPPIAAGAYGGYGAAYAPGWPYVSFPAMDPRRKFKKMAVRATS